MSMLCRLQFLRRCSGYVAMQNWRATMRVCGQWPVTLLLLLRQNLIVGNRFVGGCMCARLSGFVDFEAV